VQTGSATKVGRKVKAQISVTLASLGTLAAGNVSVAGLPYTSRNLANVNAIGVVQWANLATTWVNVVAVLVPASTSMLIRGATAAAVSNATNLTVADLGATSGFVITIDYDV
jgi:hypothetical protein